MPSVNDWATKAAQKICCDYTLARYVGHASFVADEEQVKELSTIIAGHAAPLVALLQESHREHIFALDSRRGTLRAAIKGCRAKFFPDDPCTCGADAWNARVDAILSRTEP